MGLVTYGEENSKSINVSFLKAPNIPPTAPPPPRRGKNLSQQTVLAKMTLAKRLWYGGGLNGGDARFERFGEILKF